MENSPLTKRDLLDLRNGVIADFRLEFRQEFKTALDQQSHELRLEFKQELRGFNDAPLQTMEITERHALLRETGMGPGQHN